MSISSWAGKPLPDAVCHFPVYFLLLPPVCFSQSKKSIKSVLGKQELANRGKHILQSPSTLLGRKLEMPVLNLEQQSLTRDSVDNQQRAVCWGGRLGITGLDKSISPALSPYSLYVLESINSCLPFMSGFVQTRVHRESWWRLWHSCVSGVPRGLCLSLKLKLCRCKWG